MADVEVQTNLAATVAPTVTDDEGDGWSVFSPWVDIVANRVYFAANVGLGVAVWREVLGGVIDSGANNEVITNDGTGGLVSESAFVFDGTNVGIGTVSPTSPAHVFGTINSQSAGSAPVMLLESDSSQVDFSGFNNFGHFEIVNSNQTANTYAYFGFSDNAGGGFVSALFATVFVDHDNNYGDFYVATRAADGLNIRMMVKSAGSVGINNITPAAQLDVTAPASTVGFNIDLDATPGNALTVTDSGSNILFAVDETGQVGVGTDSPSSAGGFAPLIQIEGDFPAFVLNSTRAGGRKYAFASNVSGGSGFFNIFDETAAIHRMVIDASGNVGVNTVTPQALFELRANPGAPGTLQLSTAEATVVDGDELGRIDFRAPVDGAGGDAVLVAASIYAEAGATFSSSVNTTDLVFATGDSETATEKMRVDSVGNVGIGVTSPLESLQVDDAIAISSDAEGSTARLTRRTSHETHTLANAATSDTTTISIPSGARLLAVSSNVNTAVVDDGGDNTWSMAFITGSTTTLATGAAAAQNTKVDLMLPDEISTGICQIRFTSNGGNFTAGVIEIVAYYETLTSLANAA